MPKKIKLIRKTDFDIWTDNPMHTLIQFYNPMHKKEEEKSRPLLYEHSLNSVLGRSKSNEYVIPSTNVIIPWHSSTVVIILLIASITWVLDIPC